MNYNAIMTVIKIYPTTKITLFIMIIVYCIIFKNIIMRTMHAKTIAISRNIIIDKDVIVGR